MMSFALSNWVVRILIGIGLAAAMFSAVGQ
jgi:uncharacterized protein YgfB (UPF0149 family)